jgi:hypothetical protein
VRGRGGCSKQTNASLEDLNRKITNLMNILLNLGLLVFSDVEIYENSLLVASIALSFILVLFQMQVAMHAESARLWTQSRNWMMLCMRCA